MDIIILLLNTHIVILRGGICETKEAVHSKGEEGYVLSDKGILILLRIKDSRMVAIEKV